MVGTACGPIPVHDQDGDHHSAISVGGADCDDTDPNIHPGVIDDCNGRDDDCDGQVDEDGWVVWYPDVDGDGVGTTTGAIEACDAAEGFTDVSGDCDDHDPRRSPDFAEVPGDGIDNDCVDGDRVPVLWLTEEILVPPAGEGSQHHAAVTFGPLGDWWASWVQGDADNESVWSRGFDPNSDEAVPTWKVSDDDAIVADYPQIEFDERGYLVSWNRRSGESVQLARFDTDGSEVLRIIGADPAAYDVDYSDHSIGASGFIAVGWYQEAEATGYGVQTLDGNLNPLEHSFLVETQTVEFSGGPPSVSGDPADELLVAWAEAIDDISTVWIAGYLADGTPTLGPIAVDSATGNLSRPDVARGSDASIVVVWRDQNEEREGRGCWIATYTEEGQLLTPPAALDGTGRCNRPAIDVLDEVVAVVWDSAPTDETVDVFLQVRRLPDATPLIDMHQVNTWNPDDQKRPDVALTVVDDTLHGVIAWESTDQDGDRRGVYARRFTVPELPLLQPRTP